MSDAPHPAVNKVTEETQSLLQLLDGHDSKTPVSLTELVEKSGIFAGLARSHLMNAYAEGKVNTSLITRNGVTDEYYWPTGVIRPIPLRDYKITNTPRRTDQQPTKAVTKQETDTPMDTRDTAPEPAAGKTKTERIIDHLLQHRSATSQDLGKLVDTTAPGAFLKAYIKAGLVTHMHDGTAQGNVYSVTGGATRDDFERIRQLNPSYGAQKKTAVTVPEKLHAFSLVENSLIVPTDAHSTPSIKQALEVVIDFMQEQGLSMIVDKDGASIMDTTAPMMYRTNYRITPEDITQTISAIRLLEAKRAA